MNLFYKNYIDIFKSKYFKFSGRASRGEFWYFALFNVIVSILLFVLDFSLGTLYTYEVTIDSLSIEGIQAATVTQTSGYLSSFYAIFVLFPSMALGFRRLHDIGKSAWWFLIALVPLLGMFVILYFYIKKGDEGENKFGPNPLSQKNTTPYEPLHTYSDPEAVEKIKKIKKKRSQNVGGFSLLRILGSIFKTIFLVILLLVAGVVGIYYYLNTDLQTIEKTVRQELKNQTVEQKVEFKNNQTIITLPLTQEFELLFYNLKLCTPDNATSNFIEQQLYKQVDSGEYNVLSICDNGLCRVSIGLDSITQYPQSIKAYILDSGVCIQKEIQATNKPSLKGYKALLEITPQMQELLQITSKEFSVTTPKVAQTSSWQLFGTKKINLFYEDIVKSDTLIIDGKPRAQLQFQTMGLVPINDLQPTANIIPIDDTNEYLENLKTMEKELDGLKQEKNKLMLKLQMNE